MSKIDISKYPGLIDRSIIKNLLSGYRSPNDKISEMISSGEIIQLQRGKYISKTAIAHYGLSEFSVANALYGPSYISGFSALSYHGLIPERVVSIESVTTLKSKIIETPVGRYDYQKVRSETFNLGIIHVEGKHFSYLMANPTKALIDTIWINKIQKVTSMKSMESYLFENLRIDEAIFISLDLDLIHLCMNHGIKSRLLYLLAKALKKYKDG